MDVERVPVLPILLWTPTGSRGQFSGVHRPFQNTQSLQGNVRGNVSLTFVPEKELSENDTKVFCLVHHFTHVATTSGGPPGKIGHPTKECLLLVGLC